MTESAAPVPPASEPSLPELMAKAGKSMFLVELIVSGKMVRAPLGAINRESISHMCAIFVSTNWPLVTGYRIYNADASELLEMVDGLAFANHFMPTITAIVGAGVLKSVVPVKAVGPGGENLQKLQEEARAAGRLVQFGPLTGK